MSREDEEWGERRKQGRGGEARRPNRHLSVSLLRVWTRRSPPMYVMQWLKPRRDVYRHHAVCRLSSATRAMVFKSQGLRLVSMDRSQYGVSPMAHDVYSLFPTKTPTPPAPLPIEDKLTTYAGKDDNARPWVLGERLPQRTPRSCHRRGRHTPHLTPISYHLIRGSIEPGEADGRLPRVIDN